MHGKINKIGGVYLRLCVSMFFRKKKNTHIISFKEKKWKIEFSLRDVKKACKKGGYRLGIFAVMLLLVVYITASTPGEAQVAQFYAGTCLGEWEGPQQAEGEPQAVLPDANLFSSENSAVSRGKGASMFCGNFQGTAPKEKAIGKATLSFSLFVGGEYIDEDLIVHATTTPGRTTVNGVTYIVNEDGTLTLERTDFEESFYEILDAPEGADVSFTLVEEGVGNATSSAATGTDNVTEETDDESGSDEGGQGGTTSIEGKGVVEDFYDILDAPTDMSVEYSVPDDILEMATEVLEEVTDTIQDTISVDGDSTEEIDPSTTPEDGGVEGQTTGESSTDYEPEAQDTSETEEVVGGGDPVEEETDAEEETETTTWLDSIYKWFEKKAEVAHAQRIDESIVGVGSGRIMSTSTILDLVQNDILEISEVVEMDIPTVGDTQSLIASEKVFEEGVVGVPRTIQEWSYELQKQAVLEVSQTPLFSVEYTFNSVDWEHVGYVSQEQWQDVSFVLPIVSWNDVSNVQIRVTSSDGIEQTIFLDAIMLEVDYRDRGRPVIEKHTEKRSFGVNEPLRFEFEYDKSKGEKTGLLKKATEILEGTKKPVVVDTRVANIYGVEKKIDATINYISDTQWVVDINSHKRAMRPGKYNLIIEVEDGGEVITQYQEFYWGVLAINTNKSIYEPYETANLYIGVLDDTGHTICDAQLQLVITDPDGVETVFTTEDGTILTSSVCAGDTYVEVPDYSAHYGVSGVGEYFMKLTNLNTEHELFDSFEVRASVPFVVEREGPTRIFPPATYEMKITIDANQDFMGDVYEYMPDSFEIVDVVQDLRAMTQVATSGEVVNTGASVEYGGAYLADEPDTQQMLWFLNIFEGDRVTLRYMFDAPDKSPEFYLLGPLEFYK